MIYAKLKVCHRGSGLVQLLLYAMRESPLSLKYAIPLYLRCQAG